MHRCTSLRATHCALLTAHYSLLTTHCSQLTAHYSLLTTHCSLLTAHYSLLTTHPACNSHCSHVNHSALSTSYRRSRAAPLLITTHHSLLATRHCLPQALARYSLKTSACASAGVLIALLVCFRVGAFVLLRRKFRKARTFRKDLAVISSHPIPSHLIPSHLIASHPIPSHPISSHPI